jgi:MFS family permease
MLIGTVMVSLFGITPHDLTMLSTVCAIAEFFINGAIVGMYALFAQAFPTHVRAFGSGFAIGLGRGGSFLAPIIAGYLFQAGYGLSVVAVVMALGSTMAAIVLVFLKMRAEAASSAAT